MIFIRKIGNLNPSKTGLFEGSLTQCSEAAIQRYSSCSENMQQILLKPHFGMGVLL